MAAVVVGGGLAFGVVSERVAFGWDAPASWVPDLIVGVTFLGAGVWAWPAERGTGALLAATGLAWFAGNLHPMALYWHRGLLVHALLAYPGWRPRSRLALGGVAVGYVLAVSGVWRHDVASIALSVGLTSVLVLQHGAAAGPSRRRRTVPLLAGMALSAALVVSAAARLTVAGSEAVVPALWLYEVTLCGVAIGLGTGTRGRPTSTVTDLVVELGETRSGTVRDALARTLGDRSLQIGYWQPTTEEYVDSAGTAVVVPDDSGNRSVRHVERDGRPFAVLVHDSAVLGDPALVEAVEVATRLSASNAALTAAVRSRVAEVAVSRRRLLLAADDERQRLEERLHDGPQQHLARIRERLSAAAAGPATAGSEHVRRAADQLDRTIDELHTLARGLHPRELTSGLAVALRALADRNTLPVRLTVPDGRCPTEIEAAVYYLCAEALANASKHASATSVSIDVRRRDGQLRVTVRDDGAGGADASRGTGLTGLADRVEAVGGRLAIESPPRAGTTLTAHLPLAQPHVT